MVLKDVNNNTTTASHIVLVQRKQQETTMKSATMEHHQHHQLHHRHRPRQGRVVVIPTLAHHHGTTMKKTSIIMTTTIMVFLNIMFMTVIINPHQGVQGFTTLPQFPRSPAFAVPDPPSFPDRQIEELFKQCGREVIEDEFFTELSYSVKNFYRCDISRFWLDEARRDGIRFPLDKHMHMNRDDMDMFESDVHIQKLDHGMHKNHLRHGLNIFYDGDVIQVDRHHDDYNKVMDRDDMNGFENERQRRGYGNDDERRGYDYRTMMGRREFPRDRHFDTERFGGGEFMNRREFLKREENFCRRAERAEYCLGGDMMVSCMSRKAQLIVRDEMERQEKSLEEAKYFLGRVQEYLEESLCKRLGGETLQCEVPMQELGFQRWPLSSMFTKYDRFPLGGCRSVSKRF